MILYTHKKRLTNIYTVMSVMFEIERTNKKKASVVVDEPQSIMEQMSEATIKMREAASAIFTNSRKPSEAAKKYLNVLNSTLNFYQFRNVEFDLKLAETGIMSIETRGDDKLDCAKKRNATRSIVLDE